MISPNLLGILGIVGLIFLVALGVRVYLAAALVGLLGLVAIRGWGVGSSIVGSLPFADTASYPLSVLPMFILIGYFAFYAGLTKGIFHAARQWLGFLPGGIAIATVFASAGFGALSGASTASAAVFARIAIPEMLDYGYDRRLAAGVVAAAGTLAALIPPSSILVIYGLFVEESVGKLLLAGVLPGLLSAVVYAAVTMVRVTLQPGHERRVTGVTWADRFRALPPTSGMFVAVAIIIGGIYTGVMTPTEAGACGAMVVFAIGVVRGRIRRAEILTHSVETLRLTVMIFAMIWSVLIFARFLAFTGAPHALTSWIVSLPVPPLLILLFILFGYLILGMFMDSIGMLMLTLPVVFPTIIALGYDPIWFGIILVKMVEIGLCTPPVGLNCFAVSGACPDIPLHDVFRGVGPYVIADLIVVGLLIAFPTIALILPTMMR